MTSLMEKSQAAFKLKASLFTLTTLHLFNPDTQRFYEQLRLLIEKTPQFFQQLPIILDLSPLKSYTGSIDFSNIIHCMRQHNLIPVGMRGGNIEQQTKATQAGLAQLANIKSDKKEYNISTPPITRSIATKLVMQPVRSGQQIYAKNSDLIVVATVSPGAELLADGNIHIYGRLKGRALAGVTGNQNTHIFCQHMEAELVAIAGHYWLSEDLSQQEPTHKINIQISLKQERLQIKSFA